MKKKISITSLTYIYITVIILWSFYRRTFHFPIVIEESIIKPILWFIPIFIIVKKPKLLKQIFIFRNLSFKTLLLSIFIGVMLPLFLQILPILNGGGKVLFPAANLILINLWVSLFTAGTEEIFFRGLLLQNIQNRLSNMNANILVSILFLLIHIPIILISNKGSDEIFFSLYILFVSSLVYGLAFIKTKNLIPSIIIHAVNNFSLSFIYL